MVRFEKVPLLLGLALVLTVFGALTKADGPVCGTGVPEKKLAEQTSLKTSFGERQPQRFRLKELLKKVVEDQACGTLSLRNTQEDILLMKDLHTDGFRLSIAWPRIFPPKTVDGTKIGSKPFGGKLEVYSKGLSYLLKYIKNNYGDPEIMITENGYREDLDSKHDDIEFGTKDHNRMYYLQRHLYSMHKAICEDKVNVTGYFVWLLMDNFEWQEGYTARFGLYYIDFKNNLTRHQKVSGKYYSDFLKPGFPTSKLREEL